MTWPEAEDEYSPYTFIYQLTLAFGTIFIVGPFLVPRGPNQEVIRAGIMLSAFYMWLAWVTIYCSQIHPMMSLTFSNKTLAFLAYSWGSVKKIPVVNIPATSTSTVTPRTRKTSTTTTQKTTSKRRTRTRTTSRIEYILTTVTEYVPRTTTTTTTPSTTTTSTTSTTTTTVPTTVATTKTTTRTTTTKTTTTTLTTTTRKTTKKVEMYTVNFSEGHFEVENSEDNKGRLEFQLKCWSDANLYLGAKKGFKDRQLPYISLNIGHVSSSQRLKIRTELGYKRGRGSDNDKEYILDILNGNEHKWFWLEWDGKKITFGLGKGRGHLLIINIPEPLIIKYGLVNSGPGGHWTFHKGVIDRIDGYRRAENTLVSVDNGHVHTKPEGVIDEIDDFFRRAKHTLVPVDKGYIHTKTEGVIDEIDDFFRSAEKTLVPVDKGYIHTKTEGDNDDIEVFKRAANTLVPVDKGHVHTETDFLIAKAYYRYYKVAKEPISLRVLIELQSYRQFFVLLSTTHSKTYPRILIKIGANNGTTCLIKKNKIMKVKVTCHMDWRKNSYLPFWVWFKNGEIYVKSGYGDPNNLYPFIAWVDPEPFIVNFFGIRTTHGDQLPIIVNDIDVNI